MAHFSTPNPKAPEAACLPAALAPSSFPSSPPFSEEVLGGYALWRCGVGEIVEAPFCFLCWQRIVGWGEEVEESISCFSFFACKDFGSFHYTESQGFLSGESGWEKLCAPRFVSTSFPLRQPPRGACLGKLEGGAPTGLLRVCLEHALSLSAHREGRYFSSRSRHFPTSIPGFEKGIPSLSPRIPRHGQAKGRASSDSSRERRGQLFFNDHPSTPSLDAAHG